MAGILQADGTKCYSGPNCLRHGKKSLPKNFIQLPVQEQLKALEAINNPLSTQTPEVIDTQIAELYEQYYKTNVPLKGFMDLLKKEQERQLKADPLKDRHYQVLQQNIDFYQGKVDAIRKETQEILHEVVPFEAEYTRRPWTRGFLVANANGHVHKNRSCSTCTPTTQYMWLTQFSGKNEGDIVEAAGETACTVCYPSAPVEVLNRPSTIRTPAKEAAEKKAAEKATAAAIKEAKSIRNPDGTPLHTSSSYRVETLASAEQYAADLWASQKAVKEGRYTVYNPDYIAEKKADYTTLMTAIAHKKGITFAEAEEELKPRFERKYKRDWLS